MTLFFYWSLFTDEIKREKDFYRKRGLHYPKANSSNSYSNSNDKDVYKFQNESINNETNTDYHRSDEQVNILLESQNGCNLKQMKRKYVRCSSHATVTHLKKFVAKKLFNNFDKYKEVSVRLLLFTPYTSTFKLTIRFNNHKRLILINFYSFNRLTFFVMMNFWVKIIHSNLYGLQDGDTR